VAKAQVEIDAYAHVVSGDEKRETLAVKMALACVASFVVGIAVTAALSEYSWFEAILTGLFCGFPVFLLGAWWAARDE
jgi:hypothetical protein